MRRRPPAWEGTFVGRHPLKSCPSHAQLRWQSRPLLLSAQVLVAFKTVPPPWIYQEMPTLKMAVGATHHFQMK